MCVSFKYFRAASNNVKQKSEKLVTATGNEHQKKWINIRKKESDFQSDQGNVMDFKYHS